MNLSEPIRTALIGAYGVAEELPAYLSSKPIFTRRPVPSDAPYPLIIVSPDIAVTDEDGINDSRPVILRDVAVYGRNDSPNSYRVIENLGYEIRNVFHRQRQALTVLGWVVVDIVATGPIIAPVDEEQIAGRIVSLRIRLARLN